MTPQQRAQLAKVAELIGLVSDDMVRVGVTMEHHVESLRLCRLGLLATVMNDEAAQVADSS